MNVSFKLLITLMKGESMEHEKPMKDDKILIMTFWMLFHLGVCEYGMAIDTIRSILYS